MKNNEHVHPVFNQLLKKEGLSSSDVSIIMKLPSLSDKRSEDWKLHYIESLLNNFKRIGGTIEIVSNRSMNEESETDGFEEE